MEKPKQLSLVERWEINVESYKKGAKVLVSTPRCKQCKHFIKKNASKAVQTGVTEFGTKYNQIISIKGANGRVIDVVFAWIKNEDGVVKLVTAIPTKK